MSEEKINKYWDWWILWRASGRRLDYYYAHQLPKEALDVIFHLDDLYGRLELQKAKRKQQQQKDEDGLVN